jgi:N-acetylgalactosamine-6-sulfatase
MAEKRTRRRFLSEMAGLAALTTGATPGSAGQTAARRPNIVFILADDLGYGDIGCYGSPDVRTPNIDGLAKQGVRFTSFYSNGPECTPTRTGLMTGRYQHRVGGLECAVGLANVGRYDDAIRLAAAHELGLPVEETSIARMLKDAGYATALCGKWHLGYEPKFLPRRHGFDYFFGSLGGAVDYFHHTESDGQLMLYQNEAPVRREGYMTDLITEEAVRFIARQSEKPFFLYVAYTAPHAPYQGPNDRKDKPLGPDEWDAKGSHETYAAMIERMDQGIGAILKALDQKGLSQNTMAVFTSDNGGTALGNNAPFRGGKGGLFEGGIRVPCAVRWPGVLPAGKTTDQAAITMDLSASMVRIAGATPARPFDGTDVLREIEAGRLPQPRTLFWRQRRGEVAWRAVRDGSLKYVSRSDSKATTENLFDLARDPSEKDDLLASRPDDLKRLKGLLAEWEREVRPKR